MLSAHGIREVGYFDCAGGGQITVEGDLAFIGHVMSPHGTTILDVSDPKNPKTVATLPMPFGTHSHKVRVSGDLMIVNRETNFEEPGAAADFKRGLGIYDISTPSKPRELALWETQGTGVHRFDFDGRYAYISPTLAGYHGNIVMILDLKDPEKPVEAGRWHLPGQWIAGGETPTWDKTEHRCHHPLRLGNRLYVSYWHGGFYILDIEDMSRPKLVSSYAYSPPFPCPTHSAVPIPFPINGRKVLMVVDEDVFRLEKTPPAFIWLFDITDETRPIPFSTYQMESLVGAVVPEMTACHQTSEVIMSTEIPCAWFANGLRVIDIANPHAIREVAHYVPDVPQGAKRVCSNDVTQDKRGLIYLIDRIRGLHILERC